MFDGTLTRAPAARLNKSELTLLLLLLWASATRFSDVELLQQLLPPLWALATHFTVVVELLLLLLLLLLLF